MKYWKLPSWADPKRAIGAMNDAAARGGVAEAVRERAKELASVKQGFVELPGFHLFERGYPFAPYTWLVPKPHGDFQDIVMMWEAYVGQARLGARTAVGSPLTLISEDRMVLGPATFKRYFGQSAKFGDWYTPAAKIIAMAQHLEGQENLSIERIDLRSKFERSRIPRISLHLADYFLDLTEAGLYSNMQQAHVRPLRPANDASIDELSIRPLRTDHPLAVAFRENEETPDACLHALNVALRGVHNGKVNAADVRLGQALRAPVDRNASVISAIKALDVSRSLRAVYDLLVPGVMKAEEFRREFGNPFREIRAPRQDTVERWQASLFSLAT